MLTGKTSSGVEFFLLTKVNLNSSGIKEECMCGGLKMNDSKITVWNQPWSMVVAVWWFGEGFPYVGWRDSSWLLEKWIPKPTNIFYNTMFFLMANVCLAKVSYFNRITIQSIRKRELCAILITNKKMVIFLFLIATFSPRHFNN